MKIIFISLLLIFLLFVTSATAATFSASSSPTGTNAGQNNQLINFSVQNTGSVNITQLNITLPPSFTFTGVSSMTSTSPLTSSSTTPSWTNSSSIGIIGNGATQYFSIYVNTPSSTGSSGFNITTLDASAAFTSNNVTFTVFDTLAPTYTSNTTSPSSNSTYATNQSYWFNITWSDGAGISSVLLEHNITGSGTPHNETMSNSSSVYYFNTTDLAAGTYVWRVYASDTNNTFNSTSQMTYKVHQASNTLGVYLNGTLNNNITSVSNTAVNITASASCSQAACTITIVKDNSVTVISGGSNPYIKPDDIITSAGLHNYTVTVAGNANYSSNSSTFVVATVPSYSTTTTNIPLTYSNNTYSMINVTFDATPSLVTASMQGDWSGTATNYTMSNSSALSYYYNATFPAGTNTWKVFAVYSNHSFNLTSSNSFTINKGSPTLKLNATPEWTLDSPIQTNVSCTVDMAGFIANLYRNGTSVSNPDIQTFTTGSIYMYLCNNTVNANYTTGTIQNTIVIRPKPLSSLSFIQFPTLVEVVQNSNASSEVKVKNTGNIMQDVTLEISGIDKKWYSIAGAMKTILGGRTETFVVTFDVDNVDVKEYSGKFNANSINGTISKDFTLKVLPSNETKVKINDTIALYKLDLSKLENKFNEIKNQTTEPTVIEQKITELKSTITQAENYVASNNYFQAQQTFETMKALVSEIESKLKVSETSGAKITISSKIWFVILGAVFVILIAFLTYLFWPVKKSYTTETGYVYGGEKKENLFDSVKKVLSRFKRKKKIEVVLPES